jgi:hypothetical protein
MRVFEGEHRGASPRRFFAMAKHTHRLTLYPSTLAGPSYRVVKDLFQFEQVCVR